MHFSQQMNISTLVNGDWWAGISRAFPAGQPAGTSSDAPERTHKNGC